MTSQHAFFRSSLLLGCWLGVFQAAAAPVISEIYYHPPHALTSPEPVAQEWIEIHNPDLFPANMDGWVFTKGISYTFAPGTQLPAGGRLVVAANLPAFQAAYPGVTNVVGGWTGRLSNSGEAIELVDSLSNQVDRVDYADEGDWALRGRGPVVAGWGTHQGWDWFTGADGGGRSLELVNPLLRKNTGQNWADSPATGGTPGAANGAAAADVAPVILGVKHRPRVPRSTDAITVSAEVVDDVATNAVATLRWRLDGALTWNAVPMSDIDGDGELEGTIPAQANLAIVEYHVEATDGARTRTWPAPARTSAPGAVTPVFAQTCNALLQVDNSHNPAVAWTPGAQPVYRLVMTAVERAELRQIQEVDDSQTARIEAAMHATFISTDGTGQDLVHLCSVRNRGFSSRSGPPNHFSISFPSTEPWKGRSSFQLNCRYPYTAMLSANFFKLAGLPVQDAAGAQLRVNGLNPATSGQGVGTFTQSITHGALSRTESLGGDWAASHFPGDPDGNLYRVDDHDTGNSTNSNKFRNPGTANPDVYDDIYLKQTNADLNDYSDLWRLFTALNATTNSAAYVAGVRSNLNAEQWIDFLVMDSLVGNREGGLSSGRTDDFSMYRGVTDPRFVLIPHDFDTTLGQNSPSGLTRGIFSHIDGSLGASVDGLVRFFAEPEFIHLYYKRTVELCNTLYTNARLDPVIDQTLTGWVPAGTITAIKTFITNRRANVLAQVPQVNLFDLTGVSTANATLIDGMKQTPDGAATFSGTFNVAQVRSVLVNGQPATLQWRTTTAPAATAGRWVFSSAANDGFLPRGVTRVLVQHFTGPNGTGDLVYSAFQDVYNTSGGMTSVAANGVPASVPLSLAVTAPSSYLPGVPFLVGVEYRDGNTGEPLLSAWDKTVTLTANNGVTLTSASTGGGPATVSLRNGRGSLLVSTGGGAAPTTTTVLLPRGGVWKYLDNGTNQGTAWRAPAFNDSAWASGPAQLGYANPLEGDEVTVMAGPQITYYFRKSVVITNTASFTSFALRILRDDAAIVYINGTEVRVDSGLSSGAAFNTRATVSLAAPDESTFFEFPVPAGVITEGTNTVAVEVHNGAVSGTNDLSFDFELVGRRTATTGVDPGSFTLTASVDALTATKAVTSLGLTPAMTSVAGVLPAGTNTWSGVVNVTADVTVPAGGALVIEPGTHVLMAGTPFGGGGTGGADLIVNGTLSVAGTAAQPVSITCANASNRWGEISFTAGALSDSLRHALVSRGCHSPGGGHTGTGPLLRVANGRSLTIEDSFIGDSPGKILTNTGNTTLTFRRSHFMRTVMGPEITGSALTIDRCHFTDMLSANRESGAPDDEDCIYIHTSGGRPVSVDFSVFAHCGDDAVDLLAGAATFQDCIVRNAFDKGFSLLDNDVTVRRSQIVDNDIGVSSKCNLGSESQPFVTTLENCTILCENHPLNTGDGSIHSHGVHTRNKYGTAGMNITQNIRNCIISAEVPVTNDYAFTSFYPGVAFPLMNVSYSDTHDLAGVVNPVPAGTGNIAANPLYQDSAAKNLRIQAGSPCRDTGDPALLDADLTRSDMGALPFGATGTVSTNLVWSLASSPYRIAQNVTIPVGTTLTVEPGVSVFFDANVRLRVNGRMNAVGTADRRIRFSSVPGTSSAADIDPIKFGTQTGLPKWGGVRVYDSLAHENRFAFCDFIDAQGVDPVTDENYGSLGFIRSWGYADSLTFAGTHLRMLYGRNCKLTVVRCTFPDMFLFDSALARIEVPTDFIATADNKMEPLKIEFPTTDTELSGQTGVTGSFPNGLPRDGWWRVYYNTFNGNRGHQDVFDADSGRAGQSGQFILDCRYNRFNGIAGDEHIDLGGDAYIAHNLFRRASKDAYTVDTGYSNCISSGDKGSGTTIWVVRNTVYDVDHLINCKIRTAAVVEHNTCVDFHQDWQYSHTVNQNVASSVVNLYVPNDGNSAGDGAYLGYNIMFGNVPAPDDTVTPDPPGGFPRLISWADQDLAANGPKTSVIQIDHNFIDPAILDTSIGVNHPGGIFSPAHGTGNVQGNPLIRNKQALDFRLTDGSPAQGTAPGGLDYGATIPEWIYILNAPPPLTPSTTVNLTIGGPGMVAYKWRLDGGAWSSPVTIGAGIIFPRTLPYVRQSTLTLSGLADGPHTVEVIGQDPAGNWQDADPARSLFGLPQAAPTAVSFTVNASLASARINEVIAVDASAVDVVEIQNIGAAPLDLAGWTVSDNPLVHLAALSGVIPAGSNLAFNINALGVALDRDGDSVYLWNGTNLVDSVTFGAQAGPGYSLSRHPVTAEWGLGAVTTNLVNRMVTTGDPAALRFGEVFASGAVSFKEDWIEIANPSAFPVALAGLRLTDNRPGFPGGSVIPPLSFVAPAGRQKFLADSSATATGNHLTFSLDAQQELIALLKPDGTLIDQVLFFPQTDDVSLIIPGTGAVTYGELPTPGFDLGPGNASYDNALALLRGLRITELMYNAVGGNAYDWLELRNTGAASFSLAGVEFVSGITFTFGNVTLAPGQNIVLVADLAAFQSRYGMGVNVGGVYGGKLDNGGEQLAFRLPAPFDANILCFTYGDGWYPVTDGQGSSLEILAPTAFRPEWDDRSSWRASVTYGGTPDGVTLGEPGDYAAWKAFYGITGDSGDNDLDGALPLLEYAMGTHPLQAAGQQGQLGLITGVVSTNSSWVVQLSMPAVSGATQGHGRTQVTYELQWAADPFGTGGWTTIGTKAYASAWTGTASFALGTAVSGRMPVAVTDLTAPGHERRCYRLRVTYTP